MENVKTLKEMVGAVLARHSTRPTPEGIREHIGRVRLVYPVSDSEAEQLAREFEAIHGVTMDLGSVLQAEEFEPWLGDAKTSIDPYYWERYRRLLAAHGFSSQVLGGLDDVTDRVLGLMGNPREGGRWDRRGMVVGYVQSGKTANYTGLVCKAADAGYRVIIIIAGIHNNLRSQTQARIDQGFVGFDSAKLLSSKPGDGWVGVGRFDSTRRPSVFTNTLKDFHRSTAVSVGIPLDNLSEPVVFVIKKNTHTLRNLVGWLKEHNAQRGMESITQPMLLIDDEADNASINIKRGRDEVSRINGQIRELLEVFDRSAYVGYTATPFANIFVDPDDEDDMFGQDLFPRDYIVSLDPPSNYFGPVRVFGSDGDDGVVRYVDDNEDLLPIRHYIDHVVLGLPDSLKRAVRTFVLARAVRLVRGEEGTHNSMLVNVSRFNNVQKQVRNEIQEFLNGIARSVRINGALTSAMATDPELASLAVVFEEEFAEDIPESWIEIQTVLRESVGPVSVVEINSRSSGSLDYADHRNGLNVIAVGGFSLSRGLTLEGLVVSYFLRNSVMYDTLMQMGRWFGYRQGYDDLCRVWMPEEAVGWYSHITDSVEELREELRRMEAANATPREFGLKVRSHPDNLIVTARNKMGSGQRHTVSIGLANQFVETAVLRRDEESRAGNYMAAIAFAERLRGQALAPEKGEVVGGGRLVRNVPANAVLEFIGSFRNHEGSQLTDPGPVRMYIERRAATELSMWDVYFAGVQSASASSLLDRGLGFDLVCQRRAPGNRSDGQTLLVTNKQRVSSRGIERVGLSPAEVGRAEGTYRREPGRVGQTGPPNYPDRIYRAVRVRPLLVVHLLAIGKRDDDLSDTRPFVAWSISFPATQLEEVKVEYVVNQTWFSERYPDDLDEDAAGDDD